MKTADQLRQEIEAQESIAEKCHLYMLLTRHEDATWQDYLDALEFKVCIGSPIAIELHELLGVSFSEGVIFQVDKWIEILKTKGLSPESKVR